MIRDIYSVRETDAAGEWQDGMVLGNGRTGVICSCSPYEETIVFQNMDFVIPKDEPRFTPPEVRGELEEARQAVINLDESWDVHDRKRTDMYGFHPGARLIITQPKEEVSDYRCVLNASTGELKVSYSDRHGKWCRSYFVSRRDDVAVMQFTQSDSGKKLKLTYTVDDIKNMPRYGVNKRNITPECEMVYHAFKDEKNNCIGLIAHYPDYEGSELKECGYLTISRIYDKNDGEEIIVLSKAVCLTGLGRVEDFDTFDYSSIVEMYAEEIDSIAMQYTDEAGQLDYDKILKPHALLHEQLFKAVSLELGNAEEADASLSNEQLIKKQKESKELLDEMVMRVYAQGREAMIDCGGYSAPRLCGLWTGEWNPGWNGAYTMDANVNIQVAGMNTGHVYDAALGYIYFILKQIPDWLQNASDVYGMKDAFLIPVNTDGRRAMMVEYDKRYLFQYWNAGASWMMVPLFEFWQCYGNCEIPVIEEIRHLISEDVYAKGTLNLEEDVLRPMLRKTFNFWKQICTPEYFMDSDGAPHYEKGKMKLNPGEKYMIVPAYSPENIPKDYNSTVTANAAMDISAARDCITMVMKLEEKRPKADSQGLIADCTKLLNCLPEYQFDETGALREWSYPHFKDNNEHRHISHLYLAWPAYEAQEDLTLREACKQAIENRNRENQGIDDTASHGWIHKALVAARLKDGACVEEILSLLFHSDIFYSSLMTDHNTNRMKHVYCTDTILGLVGVVNEMLLYSNDGVIELLPALAPSWKKGEVHGLMARTRACVESLSWEFSEDGCLGRVTATVLSKETQEISFTCPMLGGNMKTSKETQIAEGQPVHMDKGERLTICFETDSV